MRSLCCNCPTFLPWPCHCAFLPPQCLFHFPGTLSSSPFLFSPSPLFHLLCRRQPNRKLYLPIEREFCLMFKVKLQAGRLFLSPLSHSIQCVPEEQLRYLPIGLPSQLSVYSENMCCHINPPEHSSDHAEVFNNCSWLPIKSRLFHSL